MSGQTPIHRTFCHFLAIIESTKIRKKHRSGRVYTMATVAIEKLVCQKDFFSMNMGRTARNLRVVLLMNLLVYTRLALWHIHILTT